MSGLERGVIIPSAFAFIEHSVRTEVGPQLEAVYKQGLEARRKQQQGSLIVARKDLKTFELTTSADRKADDRMRIYWQEKFPDIPWYSEDSKDKSVKRLSFEQLKRLPAVLVVDMVDGSGRLARHSDRFSSSFALVMQGQVVLALIYKPVEGILWSAQEGIDGAFRNGERIFVSETSDLDKAMVSTAYAWDLEKRRNNQKTQNRLEFFTNQRVGTASSVLDIVDVAQGETDAHVSEGLKPWDHAGASYLTTKAGGEASSYRDDYSPFDDRIVVSNGVIHEDLLRIINRKTVFAAFTTLYRIKTRGDISKERGLAYKSLMLAKEGIIFLGEKASRK